MINKIISRIFEILKMRFVNITSRILLLIFGLIMHVENYFTEKKTPQLSPLSTLLFLLISVGIKKYQYIGVNFTYQSHFKVFLNFVPGHLFSIKNVGE